LSAYKYLVQVRLKFVNGGVLAVGSVVIE